MFETSVTTVPLSLSKGIISASRCKEWTLKKLDCRSTKYQMLVDPSVLARRRKLLTTAKVRDKILWTVAKITSEWWKIRSLSSPVWMIFARRRRERNGSSRRRSQSTSWSRLTMVLSPKCLMLLGLLRTLIVACYSRPTSERARSECILVWPYWAWTINSIVRCLAPNRCPPTLVMPAPGIRRKAELMSCLNSSRATN